MSTAYDHYIHTELNPDDVLIGGNLKRWLPIEPKTQFEKMRYMDELRERMGEVEFLRECELERMKEIERFEEYKNYNDAE